jgi:hypothetical protein
VPDILYHATKAEGLQLTGALEANTRNCNERKLEETDKSTQPPVKNLVPGALTDSGTTTSGVYCCGLHDYCLQSSSFAYSVKEGDSAPKFNAEIAFKLVEISFIQALFEDKAPEASCTAHTDEVTALHSVSSALVPLTSELYRGGQVY